MERFAVVPPRLWCLLLILCFSREILGEIVIPSSRLNRVTVYSSAAEISRSFSVDQLEPGYRTIKLTGLPKTADEKTIRLSGVGNIEVLNTIVKSVVIPRKTHPEYVKALDELKDLLNRKTKEKELLQLENEKIDFRKYTLQSYVSTQLTAQQPNKDQQATLPFEKAVSLIDTLEKELNGVFDKKNGIIERMRQLSDDVSILTNAIFELESTGVLSPILISKFQGGEGGAGGPSKKWSPSRTYWPSSVSEKEISLQVRVTSDPTQAATATTVPAPKQPWILNVTYMTPNARWRPDYDIWIESNGKGKSKTSSASTSSSSSATGSAGAGAGDGSDYVIKIDYFATVSQDTEEDWFDTSLSLSTANPSRIWDVPTPPQKGVYYLQRRNHNNNMFGGEGLGPSLGGAMMMKSSGVTKRENSDMISADATVSSHAGVAYASAMVSSSGDLSASYTFKIPHPVNVSSAYMYPVLQDSVSGTTRPSLYVGSSASKQQDAYYSSSESPSGAVQQQYKYQALENRLLIDTIELDSFLFSYAAPTLDTRAYLKAWGDYDTTASSPLLSCPDVRVFLQGAYSGTTAIETVQPGGRLKLNLGEDRNIRITATNLLPQHQTTEEDRSTWFMADKKKFRVKQEEYSFTVRSTHQHRAMLVVLTENLPKSTEEDIKVEALSFNINDAIPCATMTDVLRAERAHKPLASDTPTSTTATTATTASTTARTPAAALRTYYCKDTGNVFWAKWIQPGETAKIPFKYRIVWPDTVAGDGKQITVY